MACNTSTYNIGIRNILLGKDRVQKFCIFTKADVASSLQNKYFVVHEPVTQAKHYFWFNVGGAGVDPAVPNATAHVVAILVADSASAVAIALNAVMNPLSWVNTTVMGNEVEALMIAYGYAYEARDALDSADRTGFTIAVSQFGSVQADMGATAGDISFTVEEQTKEITSPQTGDFVLGEIRRGATISVSFELKDTAIASIRRALNFYGGTIVTDDAASETISGYGSSNLFKSTEDVADQLLLRPTNLAADENASEDFTVHKAKLKLGEIVMSSENELVLPIEAVGYLDQSKASFANLFSYGDAAALPSA